MGDQNQRLEELFDAALARPREVRDAFLARECGDNESLLAEVVELIRHHEAAADSEFLQGPAYSAVCDLLHAMEDRRHTEANLLFAVLAFQCEYIDLDQLGAACQAWAEDKTATVPDLMMGKGWINAAARDEILNLAERKWKRHGRSIHHALSSAADPSVRDVIRRVDDPDLSRSVSSLPPATGHVLSETISHSGDGTSRYTLTRLHAEGGLGQVWIARDGELHREVALKRLHPQRTRHPDVWRRFLKEAQVTGQLGHPNIVPVYELGRDEKGQPFYTMRLVEGRTLRSDIGEFHKRRRAGYSDAAKQQRLLSAFVGVCHAISFAHSRGVLHRDLKPENVVLGDFGEVIVLDWGLAKLGDAGEEPSNSVELDAGSVHHATAVGAVMGSPAYMAPEQAAGQTDAIDVRTDVYGLGAILFEILTGRSPHQPAERETTADFLRRISTSDVVRSRSLNASVSAPLDAVCAKATARDPVDRYDHVQELLADIEHYLADEPVSAHRETTWERLGRWTRRHRTWVRAAAAALAIVAMVSLVAAIIINGLRHRATELAELNMDLATREADARRSATERAKEVEREAKKARRAFYTAQIRLAVTALERTDVRLASELLESLRPEELGEELRRFEWFYLWNECHGALATWKAHDSHAFDLQLSHDGSRLMTRGFDESGLCEVRLWNLKTGEEVKTVTTLTGDMRPLSFCADGHSVALDEGDGTLAVLDLETDQRTRVGRNPNPITCIDLSPSGELLAVGDAEGAVTIWNVKGGRRLRSFRAHREKVYELRFAPDGFTVATVGDDGDVGEVDESEAGIKVWEVATGKRRNVLPTILAPSFAYAADGRTLVSSWGAGVQIWNAHDGALLGEIDSYRGLSPEGISVSPSGGVIAFVPGSSTVVHLTDARSGEPCGFLRNHHEVLEVSWSPNGKSIATSDVKGNVSVWEPFTAASEGRLYLDHPTQSDLSKDGRFLAIGNAAGVAVYSLPHGVKCLQVDPPSQGSVQSISCPQFLNDGQGLLVIDSMPEELRDGKRSYAPCWIRDFDLRSGELRHSTRGPSFGVHGAAVSDDGRTLVLSGSQPGTSDMIIVQDVSPNAQHPMTEKLSHFRHLTRDTSGTLLDPEERLALGIEWLSTDRITAIRSDGELTVWDSESFEVINSGDFGGSCEITTSAFSSDGSRMAIGYADGELAICRITPPGIERSIRAHRDAVFAIAFSPDGLRVATGGNDQVLKVWDVESGSELLAFGSYTKRLFVVETITHLCFSPDGTKLVALEATGRTHIFDASHRVSSGWPLGDRDVADSFLESKLSVYFTQIPLPDALEWIEQAVGIPVQIDRSQFGEDAFLGTAVSLRVEDAPLKTVLARLLEPLLLGFRVISYRVPDGEMRPAVLVTRT
jgi:WD40 repeat protein/tRNA A-37 threonylcarbamoyl transferase component Bud32